jgi:predicted transcriptional regulator
MAKKFVPGSKDTLITLLTSMTDTYNVRNRINMGPLLKHIANIENQIEQIQAAPQQQQPAPVVKNPVKPASNVVAPERTPATASRTMPPTPDELDQIKRNAGINQPAKV